MANISQEQLNKWELEFIKCGSNKQLRTYVEKYKSELNNPYVEQALKRLSGEYISSSKSNSSKNNKIANGLTASRNSNFDFWDIIKGIGVLCFIGLCIFIGDNWRDWLHQKQNATTIHTPITQPIRPIGLTPNPDLVPTTTLKPQPSHEPIPEYVTEQVWIPCYDCNGSGECRYCDGDGWDFVTNGRGEIISAQQCPVCRGNKTCQQCCGNRGHYEMQSRRIR